MTDPIAEALDKFVPAFQSAEGDWQAILRAAAVPARAHGGEIPAQRSLRRSGVRRRVPARVALVAAVVVLALVVTAVAFGWPQRIVDFFSSQPAPTGVKNWIGSNNISAPPGMSPQAIPGQTRRIVTVRFNRGALPRVLTLFVAPTKSGGFCYEWTGDTGGCAPARTAGSRAKGPLGVNYGSRFPAVVGGFVRAGATQTVEARFADGKAAMIPVTWVSAPINAGFFEYQVPGSPWNRAEALKSVVALDGNRNVIGGINIPRADPFNHIFPQTLPDGTKASLPRGAETAKARKIISFRATDGSCVYLWLMPFRGGGTASSPTRQAAAHTRRAMADAFSATEGPASSSSTRPARRWPPSSCATRTANPNG